jgi:hypothetical protein
MKKFLFPLPFLVLSVFTSFAKDSPNFIIIYMDDLGWHQTSVRMMDSEPLSKHSFYKTPNVERLAEMGMCFSNGLCADCDLYWITREHTVWPNIRPYAVSICV